jgi:hypothetical protein
MNNSDSENKLYYSYSDTPFECPYCKEERLSRQMPPPGRPPQGGGMGGNSSKPPMGPPPSVNPSQNNNQQIGVKAVDPGAIKPCTYRYVYIYPRRGRAYWAWLTYVGRTSASGYKWTGRDWVYFGIDLRQIESFNCY